MQGVASLKMGHKTTLLHEGLMTMRTRTSPPHMLLLMLIQVALGVVRLWTLITPVFLGGLLMGEGMDSQRMGISSNVITFITLEPAVFHVLTPDMDLQVLGGAADLVAYGTGSVALSHPA